MEKTSQKYQNFSKISGFQKIFRWNTGVCKTVWIPNKNSDQNFHKFQCKTKKNIGNSAVFSTIAPLQISFVEII